MTEVEQRLRDAVDYAIDMLRDAGWNAGAEHLERELAALTGGVTQADVGVDFPEAYDPPRDPPGWPWRRRTIREWFTDQVAARWEGCMKIELYKDSRDSWRWRARASNGKVQCNGGEPFASKSNAKRAARRAALAMTFAQVVEVENHNG